MQSPNCKETRNVNKTRQLIPGLHEIKINHSPLYEDASNVNNMHQLITKRAEMNANTFPSMQRNM